LRNEAPQNEAREREKDLTQSAQRKERRVPEEKKKRTKEN
jgi:hypothetical protein